MTIMGNDEDDENDVYDNEEWWMDEDEEEEEEEEERNASNCLPSESYSPGQLSSNSGSFVSVHSTDDIQSHSHLTVSNSNNIKHTPPLKLLQSAFIERI